MFEEVHFNSPAAGDWLVPVGYGVIMGAWCWSHPLEAWTCRSVSTQ